MNIKVLATVRYGIIEWVRADHPEKTHEQCREIAVAYKASLDRLIETLETIGKADEPHKLAL